MTISGDLLKCVGQLRFWVYWAILSVGHWGYTHATSADSKVIVCQLFKTYIEPHIDDAISSQDITGPKAVQLKEAITGICCSVPGGASDSPSEAPQPTQFLESLTIVSVKDAFQTSGLTTLPIVIMLTLLVPRRPSKQDAITSPAVDVLRHGANPPDDVRESAFRDYRSVALRAAAARGTIVYAVGSFMATVLFPPGSVTPERSVYLQPHVIALTVVAAIAAAYCVQRAAIKYVDDAGVSLAFRVGFAAIFLGSLVALLISLPYRIQPTLLEGRLPDDAVRTILLVRLLVLPVVGFCAALLCTSVVRLANRRPIKIFAQ